MALKPLIAGMAQSGLSRAALAHAPAGTDIIFEGHSIVAGDSADHPYSYYLSQLPYFANSTILNVAVNGSTIAEMAARYTANVHPHRPAANGGDGGKRVILNIMIGRNDFANIPGLNATDALAALNAYATAALADGFEVDLIPCLPGVVSMDRERIGYVDAYNFGIVTGQVACTRVCDARFLAPDPRNTTLYADPHPTTLLHKAIAQYLNDGYASGNFNVQVSPFQIDSGKIATVKVPTVFQDETFSGTTLTNIPNLSQEVVAGETWKFRLSVLCVTGTAGGWTIGLTFPSGTDSNVIMHFVVPSNGTPTYFNNNPAGTGGDFSGPGVLVVFEGAATFTNSGTVRAQAAQNSSNATPLTVKKLSFLEAIRQA